MLEDDEIESSAIVSNEEEEKKTEYSENILSIEIVDKIRNYIESLNLDMYQNLHYYFHYFYL